MACLAWDLETFLEFCFWKVIEIFLSIDALFNGKKLVELKILIRAHRCQICNKKWY